ncbi:MAG: hypothetical protein ABR536_07350, partial [Solirubrobacterales bacterium]
MSDGLPRTGAALSVRERGAIRKRLDALRKQGDERLRDLGELIFELAERGRLSEAAVRTQADDLARLEDELTELEAVLSGEPVAEPAEPEPSQTAPAPTAPAGKSPAPVSPEPSVPGGGNGGATGETDERMMTAVEKARLGAEESATAEILALEEDLEHERAQAAAALERLQRELDKTEAAEPDADQPDAGEISATSLAPAPAGAPDREDATSWLRAQTERLRREAEQEAEAKVREREQQLLAERDEAVGSLRKALARLEQAESGISESEGQRLETEERTQAEFEERLAAELSAREEALQSEHQAALRTAGEAESRLAAIEATLEDASKRVEAAEASIAAHAEEAAEQLREREQQLRSEIEAEGPEEVARLRKELETERENRRAAAGEPEQRAKEAETKAAEAEKMRLDAQVEARDMAAAWLRGQVKSLRRDAEQ